MRFVLIAAAALLCACGSPSSSPESAAESSRPVRPNIVLAMADDLGWGETGYHGHPYLKTPVLDEMAASGLVFERFYSAAPNCSPTRASIITGRHPNRSGVFAPNHATRPEEISLAALVRDAGYRTGHFGKWHIGAVKAASPTNPARMGYEEYLAHDNFFEMNPPLSRNGAPPEVIQGESSDICVDAALDFLARVRQEGDEPFFITLWFGSPHSPYRALPEDQATYAEVPGDELRDRFSEITAMDRALGRFRHALREMGEADETLLWFTSDNGITVEGIPEEQREHLWNGSWRGHKGDLYEGGLRVPAIIEWPAVVDAPRTTPFPAVTTDIFATVLSLLGIDYPDPDRPRDGLDLSAVIRGDGSGERPSPIGFWRYARNRETENERWMDPELTRGTTPTTRNPGIDFVNFKHPVAKTEDFGGVAAWTDNRWKLVRFASDPPELYDLVADPDEERDVAAEHPGQAAAMLEQLEAWQRSVERSLSGADY